MTWTPALRDVGGTHVTLVTPSTKEFSGVPALFEGRSVTIRVPRGALADDLDGRLRMAVVVGHPGSPATDLAPNQGNWVVTSR